MFSNINPTVVIKGDKIRKSPRSHLNERLTTLYILYIYMENCIVFHLY